MNPTSKDFWNQQALAALDHALAEIERLRARELELLADTETITDFLLERRARDERREKLLRDLLADGESGWWGRHAGQKVARIRTVLGEKP